MKNILKFIPHRYPFLLIDRIIEYNKDKFIKTIKNITANDPWLQGHFPGNFIFPAVLLVESMAQTAIILSYINNYHNPKNGFYSLTKIQHVRFKKMVVPGDQLIIYVEILRKFNYSIFFSGKVFLKNILVCSAKFLCTYIKSIN
ncbi:3-hydroxyacyl-ACP dehydratase FabZ [Buchnera aphidicola]|uniref:3-hydroxyacyl-ACP dehydratase FabZ n=1 Tax=Buchnera aphidicola TaxID=9 RepID=UPI0031B86733